MSKVDKYIKEVKEKGTFKGRSGRVYRVSPDNITLLRAPHFDAMSLELAFSLDLSTLASNLDKIASLSGGKMETNEVIPNNYRIHELTRNIQKGFNEFTTNKHSKIAAFCALFCCYENEQNDYTPELVKDKLDDWSNIPIAFFFSLSSSFLPDFTRLMKKYKALGVREVKGTP